MSNVIEMSIKALKEKLKSCLYLLYDCIVCAVPNPTIYLNILSLQYML